MSVEGTIDEVQVVTHWLHGTHQQAREKEAVAHEFQQSRENHNPVVSSKLVVDVLQVARRQTLGKASKLRVKDSGGTSGFLCPSRISKQNMVSFSVNSICMRVQSNVNAM
jgi:hypothetical protein